MRSRRPPARFDALAAAAGALLMAGCAHPPQPLYLWETFPRLQYETLLRDGGNSPDAQIQALEAQAEKARGANAALPPGFRAHLGLLYLGMGNAEKARELWMAEKSTFPESTLYMDQFLKRLDGSSNKPNMEKPV